MAHAADGLDCAICCDILLDPVVMPCGHDTCRGCYMKWSSATSAPMLSCPLCRGPVPRNMGVCLRLKRLVEQAQPEAVKRRRLEESAPGADSIVPGICCSAVQANATPSNNCSYTGTPAGQWWSSNISSMSSQPLAAMQAMYAQYFMYHAMQTSQQAQHVSTGVAVSPARADVPEDTPSQPHCGVPNTTATVSVVDSASGSFDAAATLTTTRWQSVADVSTRLDMARRIMEVLRRRSRRSSGTPEQALLAAVRAVEVELYRAASSKDAYTDPATLESRIAHLVTQRVAGNRTSQVPTEQEVEQPVSCASACRV